MMYNIWSKADFGSFVCELPIWGAFAGGEEEWWSEWSQTAHRPLSVATSPGKKTTGASPPPTLSPFLFCASCVTLFWLEHAGARLIRSLTLRDSNHLFASSLRPDLDFFLPQLRFFALHLFSHIHHGWLHVGRLGLRWWRRQLWLCPRACTGRKSPQNANSNAT